VGAMRAFLGPGNATLPTGNNQREALYQAIFSISDSATFQSLAGQLLIRPASADLKAAARNDFSAVVALQDLSPFWATGKDTTADGKLAALWQTTRASDYAGWQADKSSDAATTITDSWIADRSSLLQGLVIRNTYDLDSTIALKGTASANYTYTDLASGQTVQFRGTANTAYGQQAQQVTFGNDLDNSLTGSDAVSYGNGDRLYGGKGNDTIDAKAGDDYLEGNAGDDTLIGGAGNDTLLGGAGADTYQFNGNFGHDVIIDAGGVGTIRINADVLDGGIQLTDTIWESADGKYIYVLVGADLIIGQRTTAWAATVTDTITVKNWHASELGLTPQTAAPLAPAPQSHLTVYQDYSPATNNQGVFTNIVDGQSTTSSNSGDYNVQRTTTTGQASIVTTGTAAQFIEADSWDQQITTGDGNDLVIAGQWDLPAGASDADIVNTGAGSDLVFTGQGRDIIDAGGGDDFIMSGGLAGVLSLQSEDPGNQAPAGATWTRAGMGSWGLYNDSELGDLGWRLAPYGISTAQVWQAGGGSPKGPRSPKSGDDYQDIAIWLIAINDHPTLGTGRFDCKYGELTACGAWFWFRQKRPRPDTCRRATNDGTIRSAA